MQRKKVLLINSPIYNKKVADKEDFLPPFGLAYIATNLKKRKIETEIIDAVYHNYTIEELLEIIEREQPNSVGINIFSINYDLVKELIEKCHTKTQFIVGGKSARFLVENIVDFSTDNEIVVTTGEGELITPDIVNNEVKEKSIIENKNRKVYLVNNESIYFPKNLDLIELDREFLRGRTILNPYLKEEEAIVTSRECLYNCSFCGGARSLNTDMSVRERNKESIINELNYIRDNSPETKSIRILDDLFLKNRKSIEEAIDIFSRYNFEYRAMSHILSLKNPADLFDKLKKSGCRELEIGIEFGSDDIRKSINKNGTVEDIRKVIKEVLDAGINVKGYIMYGLLGENLTDAEKTFNLAKELFEYSKKTEGKFKVSAFQFRPYHGTELYKKINTNVEYKHNDELNDLKGRQQFNFTAGNFSNYDLYSVNKFIEETNRLNEENDEQNREM